MRKLVIGDIHGSYRGLMQCFERSGFDKKKDQLISLGDIADGWSEVPECVEELLSIKNLIAIRGNHDDWCFEWMETLSGRSMWLAQGGDATRSAYEAHMAARAIDWDAHFKFFKYQHDYYIDDQNRGFVHGGYTSIKGLGHEGNRSNYYWDRNLWQHHAKPGHKSQSGPKLLRPHEEIFIGHTSTVHYVQDDMRPQNKCNVWNLDTGAGHNGKLTIMDVDTKEYWQSDLSRELYSDEKGR